jgi:hypothetical protein
MPTVMVMRDLPTPRETHLLQRGAYDKPGEVVTRGVPAVLPPLPSGVRDDRLALAQWITSPQQKPLSCSYWATAWDCLQWPATARTTPCEASPSARRLAVSICSSCARDCPLG